jgi:hypothetical protein
LCDESCSATAASTYGCHDPSELSIESGELFNFGSACGEGMSVTGFAAAPYPLNGAGLRDVGQWVTRQKDQVRPLPGCDTSSIREPEHSGRFSSRSLQGPRRADATPHQKFKFSVQACAERGARTGSVRASKESDPRIG